MSTLRWVLLWLALSAPFIDHAQGRIEPLRSRELDPARLLQDLFPVQTEGVDYEAVFDNLYQLLQTPLDLNQATRDELAATYLLDERQLSGLLRYRAQYGDFLSVYELQAVPELDVATIRRLAPFVFVPERSGLLTLPTATDHYVVLRYERTLEEQRGFSPAVPDSRGNLPRRYLGPPGQWFLRYRYQRPRQFSIGFTAEQDPGEVFRWKPDRRQYGPDFWSFHAQIQDKGRWRNVLLGDFQMQVGQGLVLSAGFVLGKSAETVLGARRPTLGARAYTSMTEWDFLRGATATYALLPNLDVTLLAARNRRDANLAGGPSAELSTIATSLQTSGLHRLPTELEDRGSVRETNLGAHVLYRFSDGNVGATLLETQFDTYLQKRDLPYNQFEFTGKRNVVAGLHGAYTWRGLNLFGEVARSSGSQTNSGGVGVVAGAVASLNRYVDVTVLARHYDRNFHSFYANGFGEGSRTINESGLYVGSRYVVHRRWALAAYADAYRFPGLRYLVDAPSRGFEYLLSATYTPDRQTKFYVVWREEREGKNDPKSGEQPRPVVLTARKNLVVTAEWMPARYVTLRSRAQWGSFSYAQRSASNGFVLAQDATFERGRWQLSGRLAWFSTNDWDARQYVYERDVLYSFTFPAYHERGWRHYLMLYYTATRNLDLWLRWARTDLTNQGFIGSDLDRIDRPHRTQITLQARWRFGR